jgi:hypothetical protein
MNTLLDPVNSQTIRSSVRSVNPVDAALRGLAERLASNSDSAAHREQIIPAAVQARLPARTNGLPHVRRVGTRLAFNDLKPRIPPGTRATIGPRDSLIRGGPTAIHRVEFTILKARRNSDPKRFQELLASGESNLDAPQKGARKKKRRRGGVTLAGWLLMVAGAGVAAAIALWAPIWF